MNALATLLRQKGELSEAEHLYRRVLEVRREVQGEKHYATFTAMNNLAGLLEEEGQLDEAEKIFRDGLAKRIEVLGEENRDTLVTMNNLALLLANEKKLDEAEALQRRALAIKMRVLGEKDPSTITSLSNLALVQYLRGDKEGALASYREVLERSQAVYEPGHWRIGQCHENVGGCLSNLGRFGEAETELLAAWDIFQSTAGPRATRTIAVVQRLVTLYSDWNKPEEAARWRERLAQ
jgi:Flp pilus assembly protein TadD